MRKYQYQIYNHYINLIVTVPVESEEYALEFGKRTALDFYEAKEHHVMSLNVKYICSFREESVINIHMLKDY